MKGKLVVVTGRGGVGKSSFVAMSARLIKTSPKLLIDLDPDGSLPEMLGLDLKKLGIKSVSDVLYEIMEKIEGKRDEKIYEMLENIFNETKCLFRNRDFDLISLGTKFTPGCYCAPDEALKALLPNLLKKYELILVDAPAGLEHLNRKITPDIDDLFLILDPSEKSISHIERVKKIIEGVKIKYKNLFLVGNFRFTEESEGHLKTLPEKYLGRIAFDSEVRESNLKGSSLFELREDSSALKSVKEILRLAGFEV